MEISISEKTTQIKRARQILASHKLDAILVNGLVNIRYLSGFTGSDGAFLYSADDEWFLCDSRYTTQAKYETSVKNIIQYNQKNLGIAETIKEQKWQRIGFDSEKTSVSFLNKLTPLLSDVKLIPLDDELDNLRIIKEAEEIAALKKVAKLASDAFKGILDRIKPGISEHEVALALEMAMLQKGADEKSFDFIVASGKRGALPHGPPTE
ncbi:MAG: aminopeptidase P family N-terminal domain-containing protein, partial [Desulfuromonadales bacterium]|nr:aminopeptidase P family N-terminal domain-containing protein [Desulfuromonadales bacterium]